jgi:hypothetical protein
MSNSNENEPMSSRALIEKLEELRARYVSAVKLIKKLDDAGAPYDEDADYFNELCEEVLVDGNRSPGWLKRIYFLSFC